MKKILYQKWKSKAKIDVYYLFSMGFTGMATNKRGNCSKCHCTKEDWGKQNGRYNLPLQWKLYSSLKYICIYISVYRHINRHHEDSLPKVIVYQTSISEQNSKYDYSFC